MRVKLRVPGFEVMEVAAQHRDELCSVLERVDADKRRVIPRLHMSKCVVLYVLRPFEVPPERGLWAVPSHHGETGVTVRCPYGDTRVEVCDWAGHWALWRGQGPLKEVEVATQVGAEGVECVAAVH